MTDNIQNFPYSILIVDDEELLRSCLEFEIGALGYKTNSAGSGEEALEKIKKEKFDLIILDVRMANGDGMFLMEKISEFKDQKPKIIILTGFSDYTTEALLKKGAHSILGKPYKIEILEANIKSALHI